MNAKKGCLIAGVAVVVIAAGLVALVFWLTGGAVASGDAFLALVGEGRTQEAYESASAQFKARTDPNAFEAFVQQTGLDRYASSSWSSRSVENDQAKLEGSIQTRDGGTVPLTLSLVKEDGAWKVLSVSGPAAGVTTEGASRPLPSDEELKRLAGRTLSDFEAAVAAADFTAFHASLSNLWKNQTDPDALRSAFQQFIDQPIRLGALTSEPTFSEAPGVDRDGVLRLTGYVTSADAPQMDFELKYIYEHPDWKLVGVHVKTGQGEEPDNQ